jgi:predicted GH43/DUF377 family glycosyl hydrolase
MYYAATVPREAIPPHSLRSRGFLATLVNIPKSAFRIRHPMRSILTAPPVTPERLHGGRPILEPISAHGWESNVVLNPAAVLVEDEAEVGRLCETWELGEAARARLHEAGGAGVMLYRAQGEADERGFSPSSLGLALFTPGLDLVYRHPEPVLSAEDAGPGGALFHDLGLEDARCTRVGGTYYLYYTGFSSEDSPVPWEHEGAFGRVQICLATTQDFRDWQIHGPAEGLGPENDKNAALFEKAVGEGAARRYYLLHRPMQGEHAMTIHLAEASDPAGPWTKRGPIFESHAYQEFHQSWIGAGGPPLPLSSGDEDGRFLMIYHQGHYLDPAPEDIREHRRREYDLAAALLDVREESVLRSRIEPLMRPTGSAETEGDERLGVGNVLFSCAAYRWQREGRDDLVIPYAAADSRIFGARIGWNELAEALAAGT